jgi:hypothetical protein
MLSQVEIIERALKSVIENKRVININNVMQASLFFPGGTAEAYEVKKYLDQNYFLFKAGFFLFLPFEGVCYINYSKPVKIESNFDFTYKLMKTKIKAIGGFKGFKQFVKDNCKIENTFFHSLSWAIQGYDDRYLNC